MSGPAPTPASWSRTFAERSLMKNKVMMNVAIAARPEIMNWLCQSWLP